MSKKHIFLSYRSTEIEFALRLAADLKNAGVNLWMDRIDLRPGDDWLNALEKAVNDCVAMIAVLSPEYVTSKYCKRELARADRMGRPIFPVIYRRLAPDDYPYTLELQQYVDFTGCETDHEYQRKFNALLTTLREQFADQIGGEPDPKTQYITRLIADLEGYKGILEYIQLANQADKLLSDDLSRPRPHFAKEWDIQGAFSVVENVIGEHTQQSERRLKAAESIRDIISKYPRLILLGGPGTGKTTTLEQLTLNAAHDWRKNSTKTPLPLFIRLTAWDNEPTFEEFVRQQWLLDSDPIKLLRRGDIVLFLDGLNEMRAPSSPKMRQLREWLIGENSPQKVVIACRTIDYTGEFELPYPMVQTDDMTSAQIQGFVRHYMEEITAQTFLSKIMPQSDFTDEVEQQFYRLARHPFFLSGLILLHISAPDNPLPMTRGTILRAMAAELYKRERDKQLQSFPSFEELETALTDMAFAMTDVDMPVYVPVGYALEYLGSQKVLDAAHEAYFLDVEGDRVRFSYELFQEYFAALGLTREGIYTRLTPPRFDRSGRRVGGKWDDIIIMLAGMSSTPDLIVQAIAEVDPYLATQCISTGVNINKTTYDETLQHLFHILDTDDDDGRVAAARILAKLDHEQAIPLLLDAMRDSVWDVRRTALTILQGMRIQHLEGLAEALGEMETSMRDATATALRTIGDSAIPTLLQLMCEEKWEIRRGAAWALGELKDSAAVPGLVELLHDKDNLVATEAAQSLGWIGDDAAVGPLTYVLLHENRRLRKTAATALGNIGQSAINALVSILNDTDNDFRRLAIEGLKSIASEVVTNALLDATHDQSADVRTAAVEALEGREGEQVVKRLIELLSDVARASWSKLRIDEIAARLLEMIASPEATSALKRRRKLDSPTEEAPKVSPPRSPLRGKSPGTAIVLKERLDEMQGKTTTLTQTATTVVINELNAEDWKVRRDAVRALAKQPGENGIPKLLKALSDTDEHVRIEAVKGLGSIRTDSALQELLKAFDDTDELVRDAAEVAFASYGPKAVNILLNALKHTSPNIRAGAIKVLGNLRDIATISALEQKLYDPDKVTYTDQPLSELAAIALYDIGTPAALKAVQKWRTRAHVQVYIDKKWHVGPESEPTQDPIQQEQREVLHDLIEAMHSDDWQIRQDAANALREYAKTLYGLKDPSAIKKLCDALNDADWVIRWSAAEALAWIGDWTAVPALRQTLADDNWSVRLAVVRSFIEIGDPTAVPALLNILGDKHTMVREAATEALGVLQDKIALPGLTRTLDDSEPFVRLAAVEALAKFDDPSTVKPLVKALQDEDDDVRWGAANALVLIGTPEVVKDLSKLLNDTNRPRWERKRICDLVAEALEHIGTPDAKEAVAEWKRNQND